MTAGAGRSPATTPHQHVDRIASTEADTTARNMCREPLCDREGYLDPACAIAGHFQRFGNGVLARMGAESRAWHVELSALSTANAARLRDVATELADAADFLDYAALASAGDEGASDA